MIHLKGQKRIEKKKRGKIHVTLRHSINKKLEGKEKTIRNLRYIQAPLAATGGLLRRGVVEVKKIGVQIRNKNKVHWGKTWEEGMKV